MLMDIAHEQPIAVLLGKRVRQIETCAAVSRQVSVVADRLNVVVDVWVDVWLALLVIDAALHDMKQMRDHTAGGEALAVVVEIESPWIRQAPRENFERLSSWMIPPDSTVDELSLCLFVTGFADVGMGEDSVATVKPAVRSPDETVQRFVAVANSPTIKQHFRWAI